MNHNQHVLPVKNGWAVKDESNPEFTSTHKTLSEAIDAARRIAKKEKAEIIIHKKEKMRHS